jgi:hypothetical protein
MPTNVLMFSAIQMKKPIKMNDSNKGMCLSLSSGRKITVERAYSPRMQAAMYQRKSPM